jgi:hypothetical protein
MDLDRRSLPATGWLEEPPRGWRSRPMAGELGPSLLLNHQYLRSSGCHWVMVTGE